MRPPAWERRRLAPIVGLLLVAGCAPGIRPPAPPPPLPDPVAANVERVLFLVGDAGKGRFHHSPLFPRLQQDVEWWAGELARDSAVTVLFLGDMVYPVGVRDPDSPEYASDTAYVADQVRTFTGPTALRYRTQGFFTAGNHDWGLREDWEGYDRLENLEQYLWMLRELRGLPARLTPRAGSGGPYVVDWGPRVRLLLIDTAWWLVWHEKDAHRDFLARMEEAMRTAGGRDVVVAAHHPFKSSGPHGGEVPIYSAFGFHYLLARSGAILQDLNSVPYRELERGLRSIFARTGPPLVFAGGHEHSLQVHESVEPTDPAFSLVSGSGSKLSGVGLRTGMRYAESIPGYMRVVFEKGGGVTLFVEGGDERFLVCPDEEPERTSCMAAGIAAFRTVYSQRIR